MLNDRVGLVSTIYVDQDVVQPVSHSMYVDSGEPGILGYRSWEPGPEDSGR